MVVSRRSLKRANCTVTADLFCFSSFAADEDSLGGSSSFGSRVRAFLEKHARMAHPSSPPFFSTPGEEPSHLLTRCVTLRVDDPPYDGGALVDLEVVEEDVRRARSVYCNQCRVVGWSAHPVCAKRYHFIIRNDTNSGIGYTHICIRCGGPLESIGFRCAACEDEVTDDSEDWYFQLENTTHLLHGVVHGNGFGHLLRINGREGGSKHLSGRNIMAFWDRLCNMLCVRKVSVMDVSKKYGMDYRLLHAVMAGHVWYGNWGYEFGAGSFGVSAEVYRAAVNTLSNVPLSILFTHARSRRTKLQNTILMYQSMSDGPLETLRELFCLLLRLLHDSNRWTEAGLQILNNPDDLSGTLCAWTADDIEKAEMAMVSVLRAVGDSKWVPLWALKGATCYAVAATELLNYCLRNLKGKLTYDGLVVDGRHNAETNCIEYRLKDASQMRPSKAVDSIRPSKEHMISDIRFLYHALLHPVSMHAYRSKSARQLAVSSATRLLDCKQFVKHYDRSIISKWSCNPFAFCVWCHIEVAGQPKDFFVPPELLLLHMAATISDLKLAATEVFQKTYLILRRFQAEQLLGYESISDDTNAKLLLGANGICRVKGRCYGDARGLDCFRMERGLESWIVDCICGAEDDDGERMLACDSCGIWQHTRCAGIEDMENVPAKFVCKSCMGYPPEQSSGEELNSIYRSCKDEFMQTLGGTNINKRSKIEFQCLATAAI